MDSFKDGILIDKVENVSIDEEYLTADRKINVDKMELIIFDMTSNIYRVIGNVVGKAFKD